MSENRNEQVESAYKARNKVRINAIFGNDIDMFPKDFWQLYYGTEAENDDICIELDVISDIHEHGLEDSDRHKLTYCCHKTRVETLRRLLSDKLGNREIIIDFSEPWQSDILAKFLRNETDWDKSKMGIVKQTNNDASGDTEG